MRLVGDLVTLRDFLRRDAPAVHGWTGDLEVVRYLPLGPCSPAEARELTRRYVAAARAHPRDEHTLAIVPNDDPAGLPVGAVSLGIDSRQHRRGEIGYALRRDRWGRGYAGEAVRLVLDLGFGTLGLERIWAVCDPDNAGSIRVLERAGLRYEGRLRGDMLIHGERRDSLLYGLLASDRIPDTYL